jgi:putative ABC transport system substrate-binding protein
MNKKVLLTALVILTFASFRPTNAQPTGKIARIGIIAPGKSPQLRLSATGLRDFGYTEGQNLLIDYRYVEGKHDRIPELIAEVLNLKIDIIVQWAPWLLSRPKSSRISRLFSAPAVIRLQLE